MDGKTEALFTSSTAQTKLRINPLHLQTCLLRIRLALRRLRTSRCKVIAERNCFYPCFVAAPSLIVHNASVFPGGSGEKQGKAKKTEKYSMDFSKILFTHSAAQTKLHIDM
ncbi:MAG TPA: hypothetical protein PKW86_06530 [bacterium]|nr:hypothetical protein [bacterium]